MLSFDLGLVCPTSHDMTCHVQHVQPITLDVRGESRTALVQQSERLTGRGLAGQAPSPGRWRTAQFFRSGRETVDTRHVGHKKWLDLFRNDRRVDSRSAGTAHRGVCVCVCVRVRAR